MIIDIEPYELLAIVAQSRVPLSVEEIVSLHVKSRSYGRIVEDELYPKLIDDINYLVEDYPNYFAAHGSKITCAKWKKFLFDIDGDIVEAWGLTRWSAKHWILLCTKNTLAV